MSRETGQVLGNPRCPCCGAICDGFTPIEDEPHVPTPGDVSICAYCAELNVYEVAAGGLGLRRPTNAEREELQRDPELVAAQAAIRTARQNPGWPRRERLQ